MRVKKIKCEITREILKCHDMVVLATYAIICCLEIRKDVTLCFIVMILIIFSFHNSILQQVENGGDRLIVDRHI